MAKLDTLVNSFAVDFTGFTEGVTGDGDATIAHGCLSLDGGTSASSVFVGSTATYDSDESSAYFQLVSVPLTSGFQFEASLLGTLENGYRLRVAPSLTGLRVDRMVAGSGTQIHLVTYNPVAHKWLRFREASGTFFVEAAPDSGSGTPGTFVTLVSEATTTNAAFVHTDVNLNFGSTFVSGANPIAYLAGCNTTGIAPLVSFVAAGTEGSAASGNVTPGAPAGIVENDLLLCVAHSSDQVAHSMAAGWTEVFQGNGGGTTSHLSLWKHRYDGVTLPSLVVTHTAGQSPIAAIFAFRSNKVGYRATVDVIGSITGGTDGSMEHASITPTGEHGTILALFGAADDNNVTLPTAWLAAFSEAGPTNNYKTTAGTPDGMVGTLYRDTMAAASGQQVITQAVSDAWASAMVSLKAEFDGRIGWIPRVESTRGHTAVIPSGTMS